MMMASSPRMVASLCLCALLVQVGVLVGGEDTVPALPDVSHAGPYWLHSGPPGAPEPIRVKVTDHGADGGDDKDDTKAFGKALAALKRSMDETPGRRGVLVLPAGTFILSSLLYIDHDDMTVSGEGPDRTRIRFTKSLRDLFSLDQYYQPGAEKRWSFRGGLVWMARDPLSVPERAPDAMSVVSEVEEGARRIRVSDTKDANLTSLIGKRIHLRWYGDADWRTVVFGDRLADAVEWDKWILIGPHGRVRFEDANRILSVEGDAVVLEKPLRLPVRSAWKVVLAERLGNLSRAGIENLTIAMPEHYEFNNKKTRVLYSHLNEPGFNGIFLYAANDCFVRNVVIENADAGIVLERSQHNLVSGVRLTAGERHRAHHGITLRYGANDNLFQDVVMETPVHHGISFQDLACGNVLRKAVFHHGTIDCHRGMSFDNVRTDIEFIRCDGGSGGAGCGGPWVGRRTVNWNIRFRPPPPGLSEKQQRRWHRGAKCITDAELFPQGLLVGIQGVEQPPMDGRVWGMPPGDKGCRVLGWGKMPKERDFYQAQLEARTERGQNAKGVPHP